jgi:hypothetical protein
MNPIPRRVQFGIVIAGYASVLLIAAVLIYLRHMQYVNHPDEAMASSGMYAGGDWLLELFIVGLFLIPTFLLALIIRNSEPASTRYAQVVLGISLTAPVGLGLFLIPAVNQGNGFLGWFALDRLFASPMVIVGFVGSRLLARFKRAKRLTSCAILIEVATIVVMILLFWLSGPRRG